MWPFQASINVRESVGAALVLIALVLIPVAWMWSRTLWLVVFGVFVLGTCLFYSSRVVERERELEKEAPRGSDRPAMPSDIHDYTGWRRGGRSETMDSDSGAHDD